MIKDRWKIILQNIIDLLQEYQSTTNSNNSSLIERNEKAIKDQYFELINQEELERFHDFLRKEFSNEAELLILLLSVLYQCTKNEKCIQEVLKVLLKGRIDVFKSIGIRYQIEYALFTNSNAGFNYELRREFHQMQLNQLVKEIEINQPYIPLEKRNENRIVVITNQLISNNHAPTRNVKEICSALLDMGKEVFLIVAVEDINFDDMQQCWYNPYSNIYRKEYNGNFIVEYYGHNIRGYQIIIAKRNKEEINALISEIYQVNPQFIWYMGGTSLFADVMRKSITVLSMPFTDGYSVSEAKIMLEYMNSGSEEVRKVEKYLADMQQKHLHLYFEQVIRPSQNQYTRFDLQLPEDCFLVTIIGNRLNFEITESFIKVINKILEIDIKIHIVFIGILDPIDVLDYKRVSYLGYQSDLIGILGLMDLFVNPPRRGGGTGAYWSLFNSVPVITYDYCDVANCVEEDFICNNEDEMIMMVEKHFKDNAYHEEKRKKAKNIIDKIEKQNNLQKHIGKLIKDIVSLTKEYEQD